MTDVKDTVCKCHYWLVFIICITGEEAHVPFNSLNSHGKDITNSTFYHLKNKATVRNLITKQDLEKLIYHDNELLTGLPKKAIRHLNLHTGYK